MWRAKPPSQRDSVGLPVLVCGLLQWKERDREEVYGSGGGGYQLVSCLSVCVCVCVCVSNYLLRPNVFSMQRLLAQCTGVAMGRFVPLGFTAFRPLQGDLGLHQYGYLFGWPPSYLSIPANYNPFFQIIGVRWHSGMAMCLVVPSEF